MFYMALSLSFTAGGIILLYLLWQVQPVEGRTLSMPSPSMPLSKASAGTSPGWKTAHCDWFSHWKEGLLFVAANTGFLGGPAVLANMASDSWVPHQYRYLSTRLVTQRGSF